MVDEEFTFARRGATQKVLSVRLSAATKWRRTIAWLRRNFDPHYEIRVRSVVMKDYGDTDFCMKTLRFFVRIKKGQPLGVKLDSLQHEWAHALTWEGADTYIEEHSPEWGVAYAKIYRTFLQWDYGRSNGPLLGQREFSF